MMHACIYHVRLYVFTGVNMEILILFTEVPHSRKVFKKDFLKKHLQAFRRPSENLANQSVDLVIDFTYGFQLEMSIEMVQYDGNTWIGSYQLIGKQRNWKEKFWRYRKMT